MTSRGEVMATVETHDAATKRQGVLPLEAGDHLSRDEFERRYAAMPSGRKAELLEGVVFMPSPVNERNHGAPHFRVIGWLTVYQFATPGVIGGDNSTLRLDLDNEPQPDAYLRIPQELGGQSRESQDGYVEGAPELVAEVTASKVSYDLGVKREVYRRCGVKEYVVWRVHDQEVDWFVLREGRYEPLALDEKGLYRSEVFPGLWLDPIALVRGDTAALARTAQAGIARPEYAAFAERLRQKLAGQQP
jgi:Uma2 family endonuclease